MDSSSSVMGKRSPLPETSPPSPIPTGKGLRSAANQMFSDYLEKSVQIPELALPEYVHVHDHRWVPADMDYNSSILSRKDDSKLRSAFQWGVFRISGQEIAAVAEELRSTLIMSWVEAELIFGDGEESHHVLWHPSSDTDWAEAQTYGTFRQKINNVASKLETVAQQLAQVVAEGANKRFSKDNSTNKSSLLLSLYRYNQHSLMDQDPPLSTQKIYNKSCEYALSLHLIIEQCEFHVRSECGRRCLSFNASPDTIVVTVGKQLEEWSHGKFKSTYGVLHFEPNLNKSQSSFSMELKYSLSSFNHSPYKKTISIADQILIILIVMFLYKFFGLFGFWLTGRLVP